MQLNSSFFSNISVFIKRRLIEFFGLILITFFIIYTYALLSYSAENSTLIYKADSSNIPNLFYYYLNFVADFFLQSFGLISFLIGISVFSWGINLIISKKVSDVLSKFFYVVLYTFFGCLFVYSSYNNSFWLIDNGNSGFVGEKAFNFISSFFPVIENNFFSLLFLFIAICFFILGSSINIKKIFFYIIKRNPSKNNDFEGISTDDIHEPAQEDLVLDQTKQQSFSFKNFDGGKINKYKLPSLNLLEKSKNQISKKSELKNIDSDFLEKILLDFGVKGKIKKVSIGPVVTLYEFEPAPGIKVSKIVSLSDDIARHTSSISTRVSVIPGKNTVGIEIPNSKRDGVFLSEIISSDSFNKKDIKLPIALGKTISGVPITVDLTSMPHLLVAGTTGSGKSVCINSIIMSLLYKHGPDHCKFILIDPKML